MSFVLITQNPNGSQAEYDAIREKIGLDSENPELPQGMISHMAGPLDEGGWCVVTEWESKEDFQRFYENQLKPAMGEQGLGPAGPKWFQVYKRFGSTTTLPSMMRAA